MEDGCTKKDFIRITIAICIVTIILASTFLIERYKRTDVTRKQEIISYFIQKEEKNESF